jgi:hypothetical protein
MPLPDTYSRRLNRSNVDDVYVYDDIPQRMRVQAVQILADGLGPYYDGRRNYAPGAGAYDFIVKRLRRELGVHDLVSARQPDQEYLGWLERVADVLAWLDGLEVGLRAIDRIVRSQWPRFEGHAGAKPDAAIEEMNARLREAGVGYQYVSGDIIRIDSLHIHRDVVLPILTLLRDPRFKAAEQEYLQAHEAYRRGEVEDCLVDCGKALESVLKVIGTERGWTIKESDPASKLIQAAVDAGFLASYSQTALNHLRGLLESSTPTLRNKLAGHGAGTAPRNVPLHLASFQLHQTAAVMLYLVEHDVHLKRRP